MEVAVSRRPGRRHWLGWTFIAVSGGIWGTGAAATAARTFHWAAGYGYAGTTLCAVLGAAVTVLLAKVLPAHATDGPATPAFHFLPFWLPLFDLLAPDFVPWRGPVLCVGAVLVWSVLLLEGRVAPGSRSGSRWGWLAFSIGVPLSVYLLDLSPYVGRADTFEFQVIGPQLGIAHPSGYPLYTLICKLFSLLPLGTVAWRVNLTSAVSAALASGFLFLALQGTRTEGRSNKRAINLAVAWTLAFSPTLWSRAIEAEVYALNACLVAAGLWLAVQWHAGRGAGQDGARGFLAPEVIWPAFGLLVGLAFASHITLGALGLVAAAGLLAPSPRPSRRAWLRAVALGALGVALYAYIPLRWPAVTGGQVMSLGQFWRFVTNAGSGGALRALAFYHDPARWALVGRLLLAQVGWAGLALGALGLGVLVWTMPALALGSGLSFVAWIWFALSFYVAEPDYSAFLIPAHVVLLFWLGRGARFLEALPAQLRSLTKPAGARQTPSLQVLTAWGWGLVVLLFLLPLNRLWMTGPALDTRSQGRADEAWGRYVLGVPLAQGAAVLADSEKFPPLYYLQQVEGLRPDLELVTLFDEAQYRQALEARLGAGQPVYLARYLPGMDAYGVSSAGPLVAVAPDMLVSGASMDGVSFGDALALTGVALVPDQAGRVMHHLTLVWTVRDVAQEDLDVRLRLVVDDEGGGGVVWESPARRPVGGYTTTQAWRAGWTVTDYHALTWPAWLPSGVYGLEVGLFPHFETTGLPVAGGSEVWYGLGEVRLEMQAEDNLPDRHGILMHPALWLVGSRTSGEVAAGSPVDLDLAWRCQGAGEDPISPVLWWVDAEGREVLAQPLVARGELGTAVSCAGAARPVIRRYGLIAPDRPGQYRLDIDGTARCAWLGRAQTRCPVANVSVGPAGAGLANYAGRVLLLEAETDATEVPAGGRLRVDLRWRALEAMALDYTVFVQVIGPDGQVYGQVDSWPGQGARPTSGWQTGEEVPDLYSFYVRSDGPAGEYRVIVGMYLLADMSRLPVIDGAGTTIGDFTQVGTFSSP